MRLVALLGGLAAALVPGPRALRAQSPGGVAVFAQATAATYGVDAGFGVERFRGVVIGAGIDLRPGPRLAVELLAEGGVVSAAGELDRRVGQLAAAGRWTVVPWLVATSGVSLRTIANDAALQRWIAFRLGAEARPSFSLGRWHGVLGIGLIPITAVSGLPAASFGMDGVAGLEYRHGTLSLAATYVLERFDFPAGTTPRRHEQISGLRLRGALRVRD